MLDAVMSAQGWLCETRLASWLASRGTELGLAKFRWSFHHPGRTPVEGRGGGCVRHSPNGLGSRRFGPASDWPEDRARNGHILAKWYAHVRETDRTALPIGISVANSSKSVVSKCTTANMETLPSSIIHPGVSTPPSPLHMHGMLLQAKSGLLRFCSRHCQPTPRARGVGWRLVPFWSFLLR